MRGPRRMAASEIPARSHAALLGPSPFEARAAEEAARAPQGDGEIDVLAAATAWSTRSKDALEIRPLGRRNPGVLVRIVLRVRVVVLDILRADALVPFFVAGAQIGDGRLPGRREGT